MEKLMVKPITPDEVRSVKPDQVIEVFNELIQEHWDGIQAKIGQNQIADLISKRMNCSKHEVFNKRYLNVETLYIEAGWQVSYDKPDYNENIEYEPFFVFSRESV